jgi:hypothetical protein
MNFAVEMDRMWEAPGPTRLSWLWASIFGIFYYCFWGMWLWGMGSGSLTLALGIAWVGGYNNWWEHAHPGLQAPNWPLLIWCAASFAIPALLVYPAWRSKARSDALSDTI